MRLPSGVLPFILLTILARNNSCPSLERVTRLSSSSLCVTLKRGSRIASLPPIASRSFFQLFPYGGLESMKSNSRAGKASCESVDHSAPPTTWSAFSPSPFSSMSALQMDERDDLVMRCLVHFDPDLCCLRRSVLRESLQRLASADQRLGLLVGHRQFWRKPSVFAARSVSEGLYITRSLAYASGYYFGKIGAVQLGERQIVIYRERSPASWRSRDSVGNSFPAARLDGGRMRVPRRIFVQCVRWAFLPVVHPVEQECPTYDPRSNVALECD